MQRERGRVVPTSAARRRVAAGLIALALALAGCAGDGTSRPKGTITVAAASSLTSALTRTAEVFKDANPGTNVRFNFGASSSLADAIIEGAPVDVFASADQENMTKLIDARLVFGSPTTFAHNRLTIVVKEGNPAGVKSTADLVTAGVISLCALEVPCGKYAAQALVSAKVMIDETHITRGQNVAAALDAVADGDAVAGIVYVTDAQARADRVDVVAIPETQNVIAAYPIAALGAKANPVTKAFVAFVKGKTGQRILKKYGFLP